MSERRSVLALVNARLLDGTGAPPVDGVTVVVDGEEIASVGLGPPPAVATVIDVAGRTVMPGLIDAHVHLSGPDLPQPELRDPALSPELRAYALAVVAGRTLAAGITTVRDVGSYGRSLFILRQAIRLGLCAGPRILLCGRIIAATSPGGRVFPTMYREADGPGELRKAVREQYRDGADLIKVMATGAITVEDEGVDDLQLVQEEMETVVDEAHRLGYLVASHAEGAEGIRVSAAAGVDTIEHGEMGFAVPDALELMAERGIILVPTLRLFDSLTGVESPRPAWIVERAKRLGEAARKTLDAARRHGVTIAMGADAGPHGSNARELGLLIDAGLSPMEAIVAATQHSARACRLEQQLGTVAPGKAADLLVVDGDPLADIRTLGDAKRIWLVVQAGRPVAGAGADLVDAEDLGG